MSDWQPIEIYDKLKRKPKLAVFRFAPVPPARLGLDETYEMARRYGNRVCTHWMSLQPLPAPPETTDA